MTLPKVLSVSLQPDILLPILAARESNGLILDIGESECRVIAVSYGRAIMHSHRSKSILNRRIMNKITI